VITDGRALVTGASRGIGRAVAIELANRGFDVIATMRDPADGESLPGEAVQGSIGVQRLDVTDPSSIVLPDSLRVLVNNAGVDTQNLAVEHLDLDEWRRVFEANVFGLVEVTRRAIPSLRAAGGGVIVNVTSAGLLVPMPFFAPYRASNAAVQALSESLRAEVAPFGIRVLEVLPGPVDTDMLAESYAMPEAHRDERYRELAERVAAARAGVDEGATPVAEAARTIVDAICDDDAPFRMACDPMGAGLLEGWATTPDEPWQRSFLDAFR